MIRFNRWKLMSDALDLLGRTVSIDDALEIVRQRARAIGGADGIAVFRREGQDVVSVGEDADAPLWTGQRYPLAGSIAGLAMIERRTIFVPDAGTDPRIADLPFRATFAANLAIFPLGLGDPVAALGAYWAKEHPVEPDALALLDTLARSANGTFERLAVANEMADSRKSDARR